jgi:hypothetical protein
VKSDNVAKMCSQSLRRVFHRRKKVCIETWLDLIGHDSCGSDNRGRGVVSGPCATHIADKPVVVAGLFGFQKPVTAGRVMSDFVSAFFFVKLESVHKS